MSWASEVLRLHRVEGCSAGPGVCFCDLPALAVGGVVGPLPPLLEPEPPGLIVPPKMALRYRKLARVPAASDGLPADRYWARPVTCLRCEHVLGECTCHDEWLAARDG